MLIYIGADHRGFKLKEYLKQVLMSKGYEVIDMGDDKYDEDDDAPDFAAKVAKQISSEYDRSRGIVICGSGVIVDAVANKFPNVRSVLGFSSDQVYESRDDDDTNVLALPADFLSSEQALKIVHTWLETPFSNEERYRRRLNKVSALEMKNLHPLQDEE